MTDLIDRARSWMTADPDPATRAELEDLVESGDLEELAARMNTKLEFGTAGIRGQVGAGPGRMNRAVVIRTTYGLAQYLQASATMDPGGVILGFDARHTSRGFAEDVAGVLAAAGIPVLYFPDYTPTPLVAYTAKHLSAAAAVVVTASHNPPADNGYKVYGPEASQIVPPMDVAIQDAIESAPGAGDIERIERAFSSGSDLVGPVPGNIRDCYWEEVSAMRSRARGSDLVIVYTPLHGVARDALFDIMHRAGHAGISAVPEQADPDGTFPTVEFPNPEEAGALDLALEMATSDEADLVIANDPDGDRLAVVVPTAGEWRPLSGNEIGVLLADYILQNDSDPASAIVVSSIVSSPMLSSIAAAYGAHHEQTLTGFKWIVKAGMSLEAETGGRFVFGYEEALGYTVGTTVRDKDGLSAALIFTDLAADSRDGGEAILQRLEALWQRHGMWVSAQTSIAETGREGVENMRAAVARLGDDPPGEIDGLRVTGVADFRTGSASRPVWLGEQALVELTLGSEGRVLVRPSGTEPKLKVYVDLREEMSADPAGQHESLRRRARRLAGALLSDLGL